MTSMLDVALHQDEGPITLADISVCQGISPSYLEQLFAKLRAAGLVEGVRGPGGGYRLARPADEISIADIVEAVDERSSKKRMVSAHAQEHCLSHRLWDELSERIHEFLSGITLADFSEREEIKQLVKAMDPKERRSAA